MASIITGCMSITLAIAYNGQSGWYPMRIVWLILQSISTTYSFGWDIVVDWGLCKKNSSNFLLRNELILSTKEIYYVAIFLDFVLRYFWICTLFPFWTDINAEYSVIILSVLEILRRSMWSFFRVENEVVNNLEDYRNFDFPVPSLGRALDVKFDDKNVNQSTDLLVLRQ